MEITGSTERKPAQTAPNFPLSRGIETGNVEEEFLAGNGAFELFKRTARFDSTARYPDWLGPDALPAQRLAPNFPG